MLFKSFIISQFSYCPIVCMCHGRGLNNKIVNTHERPLRIIYKDKSFIKMQQIYVNLYEKPLLFGY